jgi:hypothetical protein
MDTPHRDAYRGIAPKRNIYYIDGSDKNLGLLLGDGQMQSPPTEESSYCGELPKALSKCVVLDHLGLGLTGSVTLGAFGKAVTTCVCNLLEPNCWEDLWIPSEQRAQWPR